MPLPPECEELLAAWFGPKPDDPDALSERTRLWFASDATFDGLLRERFGTLPDRALRGELEGWDGTPRGTLGRVLALDQLPRNLFRGSARAFAYDAAALALTCEAFVRGDDRELHPVEAVFLSLPLEHAEDAAMQRRSVEVFRGLARRAPDAMAETFATFLSFAERHEAVIARFGRFPHRNRALGRASTPEEERYLAEGGEDFSGGEGDERGA